MSESPTLMVWGAGLSVCWLKYYWISLPLTSFVIFRTTPIRNTTNAKQTHKYQGMQYLFRHCIQINCVILFNWCVCVIENQHFQSISVLWFKIEKNDKQLSWLKTWKLNELNNWKVINSWELTCAALCGWQMLNMVWLWSIRCVPFKWARTCISSDKIMVQQSGRISNSSDAKECTCILWLIFHKAMVGVVFDD